VPRSYKGIGRSSRNPHETDAFPQRGPDREKKRPLCDGSVVGDIDGTGYFRMVERGKDRISDIPCVNDCE